MRQVTSLKAAIVCGILGMAAMSYGQAVVNGNFESPSAPNGTATTADGWTLNPAVGDNYTNPGDRCTFGTTSPGGSPWSFWEQTFVQYGSATQSITSGVVAGDTYTMSANLQFQLGNGAAGDGFNGVTLANQASDPKTMDTGDLYSYIGLVFLNNHGNAIGTLNSNNVSSETDVAAGTVPLPAGGGTVSDWLPYSVSGVAPAGAVGVELVLGWQNGGLDGGTGGQQSAFATDVRLVPEPASLSILGLGGLAMLARRRAKLA